MTLRVTISCIRGAPIPDAKPIGGSGQMGLQRVHPGGFFWTISRAEREPMLLRLAAEAKRLSVIASSTREASGYAERLTLSGVPVLTATDPTRSQSADTFLDDRVSTLVTTDDYIAVHGPIRVPMAVHLRVCPSVRAYARRLDAVPSAVHVTFVLPEDAVRAQALQAYLKNDRGHPDVEDVEFEDVIDLTDTSTPAAMTTGRRRFPLRG